MTNTQVLSKDIEALIMQGRPADMTEAEWLIEVIARGKRIEGQELKRLQREQGPAHLKLVPFTRKVNA